MAVFPANKPFLKTLETFSAAILHQMPPLKLPKFVDEWLELSCHRRISEFGQHFFPSGVGIQNGICINATFFAIAATQIKQAFMRAKYQASPVVVLRTNRLRHQILCPAIFFSLRVWRKKSGFFGFWRIFWAVVFQDIYGKRRGKCTCLILRDFAWYRWGMRVEIETCWLTFSFQETCQIFVFKSFHGHPQPLGCRVCVYIDIYSYEDHEDWDPESAKI